MQTLEKYLTHENQNLRRFVKYLLESPLKSYLENISPAFNSLVFEFKNKEMYLQIYPTYLFQTSAEDEEDDSYTVFNGEEHSICPSFESVIEELKKLEE